MPNHKYTPDMKPIGILIPILLLTACNLVFAPRSESDTFTLQENGTYTLDDGTRFTFVPPVQDSRCPVDVACVWEGEAVVTVRVVRDNETATVLLTTHPSSPTAGATREIDIWSYRIVLEEVNPEPDTRVTNPDPYSVKLTVRY